MFDGNTMSGNSGHFARALVEVDLSQPIITSVMGGCSDGSLLINLSYENPLYCPFCNFVGHEISNCRRKRVADKADVGHDEGHGQPKQLKEQPSKAAKGASEWVTKDKKDRTKEAGRLYEPEAVVQTTNRFSVIAEDKEDFDTGVEDLNVAKEAPLAGSRQFVERETRSDSEDSNLEMDGLALKLASHSMNKTPVGQSQ